MLSSASTDGSTHGHKSCAGERKGVRMARIPMNNRFPKPDGHLTAARTYPCKEATRSRSQLRENGVTSEWQLVKTQASLAEPLAARRVGQVLQHVLGGQLLHSHQVIPDRPLVGNGLFQPTKLLGT